MIEAILITIAATAIHELGHTLAARANGLRVKRTGISWTGAFIVRESGTRRQNIIVSLAGPAANLIVAAAVWGSSWGLPNLVLGLINLLPLAHSDGRRVWDLVRGRKLAQVVVMSAASVALRKVA